MKIANNFTTKWVECSVLKVVSREGAIWRDRSNGNDELKKVEPSTESLGASLVFVKREGNTCFFHEFAKEKNLWKISIAGIVATIEKDTDGEKSEFFLIANKMPSREKLELQRPENPNGRELV